MTNDEMRERAYVIASVTDMSADAVMKLMAFVLEEAAKVAHKRADYHAGMVAKNKDSGDTESMWLNEDSRIASLAIADAIRALKPVQS